METQKPLYTICGIETDTAPNLNIQELIDWTKIELLGYNGIAASDMDMVLGILTYLEALKDKPEPAKPDSEYLSEIQRDILSSKAKYVDGFCVYISLANRIAEGIVRSSQKMLTDNVRIYNVWLTKPDGMGYEHKFYEEEISPTRAEAVAYAKTLNT